MAIDIAATAKGILQHVERHCASEETEEQEEFCGTPMFKGRMSVPPMLLGLSMELALKAWIVLDRTYEGNPKGHDLIKLFHRMSESSQERLKARYKLEIAPHYPDHLVRDAGLERVLESTRNAFIDWRYVYELERVRFDEGVFKATLEMILSEFESRIVVVKHPPPWGQR